MGVAVGALVTLAISWHLQSREFKRRRLDRAREEVYGPLAWEVTKMREQVKVFDLSPNRHVAETIRNQKHLEWMIESQDLRSQIAELYDRHLTEYGETIRNLIGAIREKLEDDLLQQVKSFFPPRTSESSQLDEGKPSLQFMMCKNPVDKIARGIARPLLGSQLPDTEEMRTTEYDYEQLHGMVPALECSSLKDYWPRATKICKVERMKAQDAQKNLQDRIEKVQQELEKLLKAD
jgi:hypothetical protein